MGSKEPEQPDICHNDATFRDPKTDKCAGICLDGNYPGKETDLEVCYLTAEERVKKLKESEKQNEKRMLEVVDHVNVL